jgi:uncharacterized membrane protein
MSDSPIPRDVRALAGLFAVSGVVHLARPQVYEPLMPRFVPAHREVIYASGVLELLCAAGLLRSGSRSTAGWASVALLLAVYPGNVTLARKAARSHSARFKAAAWGRLPLQLPMLRTAYRAARGR